MSSLPNGVSVNLSGFSLLFGAGRILEELMNPKAEWSGVAVTLPHWIEMTSADPLGFLDEGDELGEVVAFEDGSE